MLTPQSVQRFFPKAQFGETREVVPLTMGMSGAGVFSVTTDTGVFVLRIHGQDQDSWNKVTHSQAIAAQYRIAPQIVHTDQLERATVSVSITGIPFGAALANPETRNAAVMSLIAALTKLHAIPTQGFSEVDVMAFSQAVWREQSQRDGFPPWGLDAGHHILDMAALIKKDQRKVVSHCDLHPANILWDGKQVWLVDWERAGLAHPYLDLATISNFLSLPNEPALSLLEKQEQASIDDQQKHLFFALRNFCRAVYGAVFISQIADLKSVAFTSKDETPSLHECFMMLSKGQLDLTKPNGKALVGAAFLKQIAN